MKVKIAYQLILDGKHISTHSSPAKAMESLFLTLQDRKLDLSAVQMMWDTTQHRKVLTGLKIGRLSYSVRIRKIQNIYDIETKKSAYQGEKA